MRSLLAIICLIVSSFITTAFAAQSTDITACGIGNDENSAETYPEEFTVD